MKYKSLIKRRLFSVLSIVFFALIFSSCGSTNSKGSDVYVFSFKANGSSVKFTNQASLVAGFAQSGPQYTGTFTGYDATSNMSLIVYDDKTISESAYTGYASTGSAIVGALISYQANDGTVYSHGAPDNGVTINITQITSTTVRGTFTGTLQASGKPDMVITEGKFYLHRVN